MAIAITLVAVWQCLNVINPKNQEWKNEKKPRLKLEIEKLKKEKRTSKGIISLTNQMLKVNKKTNVLSPIDIIINETILKKEKVNLKKTKKKLLKAKLKLWLKM